MATEGRCRSVTMSTWLTLCPSLLQLSFQHSPIPHRRAEQRRERKKPQETESVCSKSLWADSGDPDSSYTFVNTHTVLAEADSIVSVRHCQHSWLLCLGGTFWTPESKYQSLTLFHPSCCGFKYHSCFTSTWLAAPSPHHISVVTTDGNPRPELNRNWPRAPTEGSEEGDEESPFNGWLMSSFRISGGV